MVIERIIKKSEILTWNEENINNSSDNIGVFVLRSSPINGAVVYIEKSNNLKGDLLDCYNQNKISDVKFFNWYETETIESANLLKNELTLKYSL